MPRSKGCEGRTPEGRHDCWRRMLDSANNSPSCSSASAPWSNAWRAWSGGSDSSHENEPLAPLPLLLSRTRRKIMINIAKYLVVALALGLALCGCAKKDEPAKLESAATAQKGSTDSSAATAPLPTAPVASGFDIDKVPVAKPSLGKFPYVGLIEGYQQKASDENKDVAFDRYEFFDGAKVISVEGRLKTIGAEGTGASAFQVFKTYESLITGLGGVRVFEGRTKPMIDLKLKFSEMRHRHPVFDTDQVGVYMLRTPQTEIWLEAY